MSQRINGRKCVIKNEYIYNCQVEKKYMDKNVNEFFKVIFDFKKILSNVIKI